MKKLKIKKGDKVYVLTGKDKGKVGSVLKVFPKLDKVLVEGVNVYVKHQKSTSAGKSGQVIKKTMPIHVSNVALVDPKTKKPTRVRIERKDGKRVRVAVKSGSVIK